MAVLSLRSRENGYSGPPAESRGLKAEERCGKRRWRKSRQIRAARARELESPGLRLWKQTDKLRAINRLATRLNQVDMNFHRESASVISLTRRASAIIEELRGVSN